MQTYRENGVYVLEADPGKILTNGTDYTPKVVSSRDVKMTDWWEVDASEEMVTLSDEELFEEFRDEIMASIIVDRGRKTFTSTKVDYIYNAETHTIVEMFS